MAKFDMTRGELTTFARELGLTVSTWSPRDGVTRYRFSTDGLEYFACRPIYTAHGLKEAVTFYRGYAAGYGVGLMKPGYRFEQG